VSPLYRYHVDEADDYIVVPDNVEVELVEGQCLLELTPTTTASTTAPQAYVIQELLDGGNGKFGYYVVPDADLVEYGDLVEVSYGSLDPIVVPEDAWWAALAQVEAEGVPGPQGPEGPIGPKGDTGAQGTQGPKGDKGDPGEPGANGQDGADGAQGEQGEQGDTGAKGDKGDKGDAGNNAPLPVPLTQAQYDALTPVTGTPYYIVES